MENSGKARTLVGICFSSFGATNGQRLSTEGFKKWKRNALGLFLVRAAVKRRRLFVCKEESTTIHDL